MSLSLELVKNFSVDDVLKIGAAYGILQILAQDLGIKTGKNKEI